MADDPKGGSKGGSSSSGPNRLWAVIGIIFILMVISTYLGRLDFSAEEGIGSIVPTGDVLLGEQVINRIPTNIRQSLGGAIIGEQKERALGVVTQGPQTAYGKQWVFVDYEDDPDGWVPVDDVTTEVGWFRALNIFPIFFDIFRPIGMFLALIFFVLFVLVMMRYKKVVAYEQKKKETEREMVLRRKQEKVAVQEQEVNPGSLPNVPANLPVGDLSGLTFNETAGMAADQTGPKNERWERVERLVESTNANDWRQAVIEADIILDEMLNRMGYEGDSIGAKLKQIEQSDFVTLNKAWEAHKVRNHLAHRGADYRFPKNEAERVIGLYRQVFQEFYYI